MTLAPRPESYPRIRSALKFYQVCSVITGVMLLLLVVEMVLKYGFYLEVYAFGSGGLLSLQPAIETVEGLESTGDGLNLSIGILIAHGWFYVVYLISCFRVWTLMRWHLGWLLLLAGGGVVPFLSFIVESRITKIVRAQIGDRETEAAKAAA